MLKRITTVISALLTSAILLCAMAPMASADTVTKEEYQAANAIQKDYYNSTYVPCYTSYRQALTDLKTQIKSTNFETQEQAQRVLDFLKDLKTRHADFYGTRETAGKSRCEVLAAREAMYKAADQDKNYTLAVQQCNKLKGLVEARVNFLNGIKNKIKNFVLIPPTPTIPTTPTVPTTPTKPTTPTTPPASGATIVFHANQIWSSDLFEFQIEVKNTTNKDISNWNLDFNISGASLNFIWVNGGSMKMHQNRDYVSVRPLNKHQNGYTIPANSTLILEGSAFGNANKVSVSNAYFNGTAVSISYVK